MITHQNIALTGSLMALLLLGACSTPAKPDPADPWEGFNRNVFAFNEAVDNNVMKPVAKGYEYVVPQPIRTCVRNVFGNLDDGWSTLNHALQLRGRDAFHSFGRVLYNSTLGVGGCIDVASKLGVDKRSNDVGTTLGVWGIGSGPYVVLPFFGPSTVRDAAGLAADSFGKTFAYIVPDAGLAYGLTGLQVVDTRAKYLDASALADQVALDKYSFLRDAYLQNRSQQLRSYAAPVTVDPDFHKDYGPVYRWDSGGDVPSRFSGNGFVPYYSGAAGQSGNRLPVYDDPDAQDVPAYEDPDAPGAAAPAAAPNGTGAPADVPQYDDPDAPASDR